MGDYKNEKDRIKRIIDDGIVSLKKQIRDDFRTNPDFKNAVSETENDKNNTFILAIVDFFGSVIEELSGNYSESTCDSSVDISVLLENLKIRIDSIVATYQQKMKAEIDKFVEEITIEIEKSDFLTEVVKNELIPYKDANRELKRL